MGMAEGWREFRCSFCAKSPNQVDRLIGGPGGIQICNECIYLCVDILEEVRQESRARAWCSFCSRLVADERYVPGRAGAVLCYDCLSTMREGVLRVAVPSPGPNDEG